VREMFRISFQYIKPAALLTAVTHEVIPSLLRTSIGTERFREINILMITMNRMSPKTADIPASLVDEPQ